MFGARIVIFDVLERVDTMAGWLPSRPENTQYGRGRSEMGCRSLIKLLNDAFWDTSASVRFCASAPARRVRGRKFLSCMVVTCDKSKNYYTDN